MGGLISLIICVAAALRFYSKNSMIFWIAVIVVVVNFWSFGVMYNFKDSPQSAPNFWTTINMITTFIGLGLIIFSFIK